MLRLGTEGSTPPTWCGTPLSDALQTKIALADHLVRSQNLGQLKAEHLALATFVHPRSIGARLLDGLRAEGGGGSMPRAAPPALAGAQPAAGALPLAFAAHAGELNPIMERAHSEARSAGARFLGTHHVLIGAIACSGATPLAPLQPGGVTPDDVRRAWLRFRAEGLAACAAQTFGVRARKLWPADFPEHVRARRALARALEPYDGMRDDEFQRCALVRFARRLLPDDEDEMTEMLVDLCIQAVRPRRAQEPEWRARYEWEPVLEDAASTPPTPGPNG